MPDWKVESFRATAFIRPGETEPVQALWTALVGSSPERIDQRPKEGTTNVEGSFEGARLTLSSSPLRTDLIWTVEFDLTAPHTEFPSIGEFEKVHKTFLTLGDQWLSRNQSLTRLAFGSILVLPVASKEEGYRRLGSFLPQLTIDPVGSSDFVYQINRPRTSKVIDGLNVNRLSRWSVAITQALSMQFSLSPGAAEAVGGPTGPSFSACRLQLDINSDPSQIEPLRSDMLVPLLNEFVELAREIATRGDIP